MAIIAGTSIMESLKKNCSKGDPDSIENQTSNNYQKEVLKSILTGYKRKARQGLLSCQAFLPSNYQ
jgi:hypothetical protein